jgi:hypothetical protein
VSQLQNFLIDREHNLSRRDGRLTVLLVLAACFLGTVFMVHYRSPIFSHGLSVRCEQLGVSESGVLQVQDCIETPDLETKARIPSRLTPFFHEPVQINRADREMLMTVKGVGPALAEQILDHRRINGFFHSPLDLERIRGVGQKRAEALAPAFDFTEGP